jgi:hypothetical protein
VEASDLADRPRACVCRIHHLRFLHAYVPERYRDEASCRIAAPPILEIV